MFDPFKDERTRAASHRAGAIAFYCMWATTFLLMVAYAITDANPLGDPRALLIIPWLIGTFTYVVMLWSAGVYSTWRDESTRTPAKLKEARLRLLLSTVLFAGAMFLMKRLNLFDHESASLWQDGINTLVVTLAWAATMWFMMARKGRRKGNMED